MSDMLKDGRLEVIHTFKGIDEVRVVTVDKKTSVKVKTDKNHWKVLLDTNKWKYGPYACICLKGEEHTLKNDSDYDLRYLEISGFLDYSFDEIMDVLFDLGYYQPSSDYYE